ncbi:MAG: SUMF1/EgtB/PvdO family nonheme iron enzyme [Planctomycetes bacterium]|nr:SUMF1/EgtB/PvdO family nonheme iron enzyme [Planctomycetota bacterium]
MKDVQAMPAEEQVIAVSKKLIELNPGFDGQLRDGNTRGTPKIENGVVTECSFVTDNVTDISPVRALLGLKTLKCYGSNWNNGMLADLSPLYGMRLSQLAIDKNLVRDLSPLSGMRLSRLELAGNPLADMSPLQDMPLTLITLINNDVSDEDLRKLEASKSLKIVKIGGGNTVTAAAVDALQKALPNCKIEWTDPAKTTVSQPASALGPTPPLAVAPFDAAQAKAHQAAWAKHLGIEVETPNSVGMRMVLIPPGEFMMGSTDEQVEAALKVAGEIKADQRIKDIIQKNERPQHKVIITRPYLIGATEVTVGQFKKFSATGYQTGPEKAEIAAKAAGLPATVPPKPILTYLSPGYAVTDDSPAAFISWNEAVAYCRWLSDQEQTAYRLPTEAEWEYACRAGTATQYAFGDDFSLLDQYGWYQKNADGKVHPVGTKTANGFGLFDMHGNLQEWCRDFYDEKWYEKTSINDPPGPTTGLYPVIRGGSWNSAASYGRSTSRNTDHSPSNHFDSTGFRIVRELVAPATTASVTTQPATPAAAPSKPITDFNSPEFLAWMKQVQAMPAEEQVKAVSKKLKELNPGFDGKITGTNGNVSPKIDKGVVTEVRFNTDHVTDISPVRALVGLSILSCSGSHSRQGKLSDLSPLQGMSLTDLHCSSTNVVSLAPLQGMKLQGFDCTTTQVSDLSPLKGMPLRHVYCAGNMQLSDLSPLAGMPLLHLQCYATSVSDISVLKDCKSLSSLLATGTKVTAAGVASLQQALPNCRIEWDGAKKSITPASNPKE